MIVAAAVRTRRAAVSCSLDDIGEAVASVLGDGGCGKHVSD